MKSKISFYIFIFLISFFFSCEKPNGIIEEINYLDLINSNISLINDIKNNKNDFTAHAENLLSKYKGKYVAFYKESEIIIDSIEATPDDNSVIYSINNNQFIANKSFYITIINTKPVFSLDNKTWYYIKNDNKKGIQGINFDYSITSEKLNNGLLIKYKAVLSPGNNPVIAQINNKREVITLKKGMIFNTRIKEIKKEKLSEKILFIPQKTIFTGYHIVDGNFIKSQYINGKIIIKALDNIYLYTKNIFTFFISLNKKEWGLNIFSFDAKPAIELYAKEDNEIYFNISTTLNYHKDKVSVVPSILKIILKNK